MQTNRHILSNFVIASLLIIVGVTCQYRFNLVEKFVVKKNALTKQSSDSVQVTNPEHVDLTALWEVWHYLERDYLETEKIDQQKMVNGAISGVASSLGDPYTMYLPPIENKRSGEELAGAFYGVGIELGYKDGILAVVAPLKGTPAEKANVQPEDLIIRVKDPTKNIDADSSKWTLNEAVETIRGPKGSIVTLTLLRENHNNNQPFEVNLERGEIVVESVELAFVEHAGKRVAHVQLSRFGERTESEWNEAVTQIIAEKNAINGIILDMRNNPGGFFEVSIDIASDFIEDGVVVTQKGKLENQDYKARGTARLKGIPVEVVVNRGSASASEIVAGALRDQIGAKLIGEKTFGKGTVQDRREISNGGGLHVTIARWLLPKGDWIHDEGIPVNIEVQQNFDTEEDEVLNKAIEEL